MKSSFSKSFLIATIISALSFGVWAQGERGAGNVRVTNANGQTQEVKLYEGSYALVIGMSAYTNGWEVLSGVRDDMQAVKTVLTKSGFTVETAENMASDALKNRIEKFIADYGYQSNNRLLIYFAGHGHTMKAGDGRDLGYIVPVDTPLPEKDELGFRRKAISMDTVQNYARMIESKHALFIFDSCFSGKLISRSSNVVPPIIKEDVTYPVRQFITAGAANQPVPDDSIFRKAFVRGIEGEADVNSDGYITGSELAAYLKEKVTNATERMQTPQYGKIRDIDLERGDFVFVLDKQTAVNNAKKEVEREFWEAIKDSTDADYFRLYKEKFPNGVYVPLADLKIKQLSATASANPTATASANRQQAEQLAQKALSEVFKGNLANAEEMSRRALELNNGLPLALAVSGWAKAILFKDFQASAMELERAVQLEPNNPLFMARLAQSYRSLNETKKSEKIAQDALPLVSKPKSAIDFYTLGVLYDALGKTAESIKSFDTAIALNSQSPLFFNNRGVGYLDLKQHDRATADFSTAIRLNPQIAFAYANRGYVKDITFDLDGAIADYTKVIEINPKDSDAYVSRAKLYKSFKKLDLALADFDRAIQLNEFNASLYFSRAEVLYRMERYQDVIRDYTKVIEIRPSDSAGYNNRAGAYFNLNQNDAALRDYTKSIELNPKENATFTNRANLYRKMGKFDEAFRDYAESIRLNPRDTYPYFYRAQLHEQLGNKAAAEADRAKVVEINTTPTKKN